MKEHTYRLNVIANMSGDLQSALRATAGAFKQLKMAATGRANFDTGRLQAQLQELMKMQRALQALKDKNAAANGYRAVQTASGRVTQLQGELRIARSSLEEMKKRLAEARSSGAGRAETSVLRAQIKAKGDELKRLESDLKGAQNALRGTVNSFNQQKSALSSLQAALSAAGLATNNFGLAQMALRGRIAEANAMLKAQEKLANAYNAHNNASSNLSNEWNNMSNAVSTAETLMAPFRASAETAMNYEAELSRSKALTQMDRINEGKTAEIARDMAMLDARYKEIGRTTQYSATEAARAGNYLAMAGFNAQQIDEGLASMVHLAIANNTELDRTADIFSNISTSMKIPNTAEGYKRLADRTTYLTTHSNQTLSMVDDTMKYVAPVASALDIELEDLYAAQKFMVDSGVRGSMAGTAMKSFLLRSVAPSKKTMEAMSEAGFMTPEEMNQNAAFQLMLQEENFELTNLPEGESLLMGLIRQYSEKSKDWSKEKKTSFVEAWAGKYAAPGVMAMLENGGYDKIQEFYKGLKGSDGAAAQTASVVADNTRGSWISLQSALEAASISIGQALLPTIRSALDSATNLTRSFSKLATENPALVQAFGLLLGAISATIVGLAAFRLALAAMNFASTSLELLKATSAFRATQSLIGASGILGTLGSTVTAGAASTAGSTAGAAARAGAAASGGGLMAKLAPMMKVGGWAAIGTSISSAFSNAFSTIVSKFGAVRAAITGITSMSGLSMFGAAINAAGGAFTTLIGAVTSLGSALRVVLSFTFSPLSMAILAVGAVISSVVSTVQSSWSELTQFFDAIGAQISNAFSSAAETLGPAIEQVSAAWANLQAAFGEDTALGQVIAQVQEAIGNGLVSAVMAAVQVFADFVTIGVSTFTVLLEVAINFATSLLNVFTAIFSGDIPGVLNSLLGVFSAVFNGAQAIATAALGAILSAVQAIAAAASSISFSSISGAANAAAAKAGAVGGHAEGGIFPKGAHLTWFAEDSAEAAIPIKRGDSNAISLWQRTGAMLGVLGGQQPSMPMPSMPSMPSMSNGYISDEMARKIGTFSSEVRKSKTYESMRQAQKKTSGSFLDRQMSTSMMKPLGPFGDIPLQMSMVSPSLSNGIISDEMARQGTYSDAVRKSKTYESLDRARRARTFSDEVVEASSQTPSMMKAGGLFGGLSPMMSALQSSNALQSSSESLSSKLQTYDELEQQSMSLSTTTNNDQSMPPITLHFHFDGAVNREDVQKGVEESLPSIRETFEQQMAKYRHEVSRRSF